MDDATRENNWKQKALRLVRDVAIFAVLALVVSTAFGRLRAPDLPNVAPEFSLVDVDGRPVVLSDYRGKKVVLNFWATWCTPCRAEIPMLSSFATNNPDVVVLGIAVDGKPDALRREGKALGITYPIVVGTRDIVRTYGASTVPTTVFVDEDGAIESAHVGLITSPQLWFATR